MFIKLIFYVFAAAAVISGISVITATNPVRSVLSLVVTFFAMAGVWMLLHAEFLSLILLLVYVGAVMTLFLFVVMMLNITKETIRTGFVRYLPFGIIIVLLLTGMMLITVGPQFFGLIEVPPPPPESMYTSNTMQLGAVLYTNFAYPFEIAGVLLLAAIIAAITLTHRGPIRRKMQNVADQVAADPHKRLKMVNLKSDNQVIN